MDVLTSKTVAMLLSDGITFGSDVMAYWNPDKLVFRPAVWVGLPEE